MADYSVYSDFDLEMHKKAYHDYFEAVIYPDGKIAYAVPSHNEKMLAIACEKLGCDREYVYDLCPEEYYFDFIFWLSKLTGCCSVWKDNIIGCGFTAGQIAALRKLKLAGVYRGPLPKINSDMR